MTNRKRQINNWLITSQSKYEFNSLEMIFFNCINNLHKKRMKEKNKARKEIVFIFYSIFFFSKFLLLKNNFHQSQ